MVVVATAAAAAVVVVVGGGGGEGGGGGRAAAAAVTLVTAFLLARLQRYKDGLILKKILLLSQMDHRIQLFYLSKRANVH